MVSHIELKNIGQSFQLNNSRVDLFSELNLSFHQGQSYAITGPSGAGKSSLMLIASGLEKSSAGTGVYVTNSGIKGLDELRQDIGFIFQQFHLLPELTTLHNVALPLKLRGDNQALKKAAIWLDKVGLTDRADHKPSQLSGGEQQRVAIARALVFEPKFIFADEPTGNLDPQNAEQVANLLIACCQENNAGLIMVTHSHKLASRAQHTYSLDREGLVLQQNSTASSEVAP